MMLTRFTTLGTTRFTTMGKLCAVVVAGLLHGVASRQGSAMWPHVETTGVLTLPGFVAQTINADGGASYAIVRDAGDAARFVGHNGAHGFDISFNSHGTQIVADTPQAAPASPLTLRLAAFGRGARRDAITMGPWSSEGSRIARGATIQPLTEWYINGPLGLEQGFTVQRAPEGNGPITIELALGRPWTAATTLDASALRFEHAEASEALRYAGLQAFDAQQRSLPAWLSASGDRIVISVDAGDADYPITIDPFIQQQILTAFDAAPGDAFGGEVAIAGNTVIVGADSRDGGRGAAYVFVRNGPTWSLQAKLVPNDPAPLKSFGGLIAFSGETALISAIGDTIDGRQAQGSAYVFVRSGTIWTQQAKLFDPEGDAFDNFGSVSLDGNTAAIGALGSDLGQLQNVGAVSVFVRSGTSWTLQQKIQLDDANFGEQRLGRSVAVVGDSLLAGAPGDVNGDGTPEGAVFAFERSGTQWQRRQKITAPSGDLFGRFGTRIAVDGNRAVVAAPGSGFGTNSQIQFPGKVFPLSRGNRDWVVGNPVTTSLNIQFGTALAFDDPVTLIGAFGLAAQDSRVFVARFSGTALELDAPIFNPGTSVLFGDGVAISGGTIVIGETNGQQQSGRAFVFVETATGPPAPPVLGTPVVTGSTVDLAWSPSDGAMRYQLRAGTSPGAINAFNGDVGNVTTLKAVNVPNGSYFVRVFAVNASGEGAASNELRVDVGLPGPCTSPAAPANLTRNVNGSLVSLTWTASTGTTSYVVEAGSASGLANLAVIDTSSTIPSLLANAPAGTYFVRVRAKSSCGLSAPSNQVTVVVG